VIHDGTRNAAGRRQNARRLQSGLGQPAASARRFTTIGRVRRLRDKHRFAVFHVLDVVNRHIIAPPPMRQCAGMLVRQLAHVADDMAITLYACAVQFGANHLYAVSNWFA
jgi:hypothetical protein